MWAYRLFLAVIMVGWFVIGYELGEAQSGPDWEVPVAVATRLATLPWLSVVCGLVGLAWFFTFGRRISALTRVQARGFLWCAGFAIVAPFGLWFGGVEHWKGTLSTLASWGGIGIWLFAVATFTYLGFKGAAAES